jgi:hypothetical protein
LTYLLIISMKDSHGFSYLSAGNHSGSMLKQVSRSCNVMGGPGTICRVLHLPQNSFVMSSPLRFRSLDGRRSAKPGSVDESVMALG